MRQREAERESEREREGHGEPELEQASNETRSGQPSRYHYLDVIPLALVTYSIAYLCIMQKRAA